MYKLAQCAFMQVTPDQPPYPKSPVAKDRVARGAGLVKWKAAKVFCPCAWVHMLYDKMRVRDCTRQSHTHNDFANTQTHAY